MVVRNSLVRRAAEGTPLSVAFEGLTGPAAVVWGGSDIVALAKEVIALTKDKEFEHFTARGGVMEGEQLTPEEVIEISKWPTREEQLGILVGQINSPGAKLSAQLTAAGAKLASQIKKIADQEDGDGSDGDGGDTEA